MGKMKSNSDALSNLDALRPEEAAALSSIDNKINRLKEKRRKEAEKIKERLRKDREKAFIIMEKTITKLVKRPLDENIATSISTYLEDNSEDVISAVIGNQPTDNVEVDTGNSSESDSIFDN